MKHELNVNDLCTYSDVLVYVFEAVAEDKHYRALYEVQKSKTISFKMGIAELLKNKAFSEKCVEHINKPENYKHAMADIIVDWHFFERHGFEIPVREPDFYVEDMDQKAWFFINEQLEISTDGLEYHAHRLLEDKMTDRLLYNTGRNGNWIEYIDTPELEDYETKIAIEYKNFLAERELLDKGKDD